MNTIADRMAESLDRKAERRTNAARFHERARTIVSDAMQDALTDHQADDLAHCLFDAALDNLSNRIGPDRAATRACGKAKRMYPPISTDRTVAEAAFKREVA